MHAFAQQLGDTWSSEFCKCGLGTTGAIVFQIFREKKARADQTRDIGRPIGIVGHNSALYQRWQDGPNSRLSLTVEALLLLGPQTSV